VVHRWAPAVGSREAMYLTMVYEKKSADAATVLNLFTGTTNLAPLLGAFLSDSYLGCCTTLGLASVASFLGMVLLMVTADVSSLHARTLGGGDGGGRCGSPRLCGWHCAGAVVWLALCGLDCQNEISPCARELANLLRSMLGRSRLF
jgi:dipeptide/tripeptide permease